jgi:hypothetical protein
MAGQGRKTFVAGEVLTAQDVNDYLMDQSVMNFATTAARSSAIPTPTEGMLALTKDTDEIDYYNGSAWVPALPVGSWYAYTPTLTNVTLGVGGTSSFVYSQIGKTVHVRGTISIAGAGTVGASGFVDFSLPVTPVAYTFLAPQGQAVFYNGTSIFTGQILYISATASRLTCQTASGTYATATDISTSVPFAWGSGATRQMFVNMTYEAA